MQQRIGQTQPPYSSLHFLLSSRGIKAKQRKCSRKYRLCRNESREQYDLSADS